MPDRIGPSRRSMFDIMASMVGQNLGATPVPEPIYDMGFEEDVTVKPISPGVIPPALYGQDRIKEITLGSPGRVPEGVYLPPRTYETEIPSNYPNVRAAYEQIKVAHPDLAARVPALRPRPDWLGTTQTGGVEPEGQTLRNIDFNPILEFMPPEQAQRTLRHELVHFGQGLNRPNAWQPERGDELPAYYSAEGRYSSPLLSPEESKQYIDWDSKATRKVRDDQFEADVLDYRRRRNAR